MKELVFKVSKRLGGWVVEGRTQVGSVMDAATALRVAEDMAAVVRQTGQAARVVVEDGDRDAGT